MLASNLKDRIRAKQLTIGPMMTFDFWPGYLEIFKAEGMDYVVVDLEHGSATLPMVEDLCRTARLIDLPIIIRPESCVFHLLRKYLDMGAAGLLIPWTESQEQVEVLRDAIFLPPAGRRGPGGPSIFANRTLDRQGWDEIESSLFVALQIESRAGVENVLAIACQDWVDATIIGPYDLSLNLSRWADVAHPDVVAAIDAVHAKSLTLGKPCGMVTNSLEAAKFWIGHGMHFFICSEVSYMVRQHARVLAKGIRELFGEARAADAATVDVGRPR